MIAIVLPTFDQFVNNGWDFVASHLIFAAFIFVGFVFVFYILAGTAGVLPGGIIAILGYGAISLAFAFATCCVIGSIGSGSATGGGPIATAPGIRRLVISQTVPGGLSVELQSSNGTLRKETWTQHNLDTSVKAVCNALPSDRRMVDIEFENVPEQLHLIIIEEFRGCGVLVNESVTSR